MPTQSEALEAVDRSLAALPAGRWVLAVSGGRDSMVLLDAMAQARRADIAAVASFDHGTGPAARKAVAMVERTALALELPVVTGVLQPRARTAATPAADATGDEASWREARWRFLNGWAAELQAGVLTAHTWDDQVETVLLRLLRGSGPRGLAGMRAAASPRVGAVLVQRPLLGVRRTLVADYAAARGLRWVEDPSNRSLAHARNRVRLEILPALERAAPGFAEWCWSLSGRAAAWRAELERWVDDTLAPTQPDARTVVMPAAALAALDAESAGVVWPELGARIGVVMDRRGIARVAAWAPTAVAGGRVPLSGGAEVQRTASTFVLRALY